MATKLQAKVALVRYLQEYASANNLHSTQVAEFLMEVAEEFAETVQEMQRFQHARLAEAIRSGAAIVASINPATGEPTPANPEEVAALLQTLEEEPAPGNGPAASCTRQPGKVTRQGIGFKIPKGTKVGNA